MSNSDDRDYEIGYGRPPHHTQFKKGQSGNPKGRRRGVRNFSSDVVDTLKAPVPVTEAGRKRNVSTQKAALLRLREKALKGDGKALDRLLALAQAHNNETLAADAGAALPENDRAIIEAALARRVVSRDAGGNER